MNRSPFAVALLIPVGLAVVLATAPVLSTPRFRTDDDFGVFWVSVRRLLAGENPYDPRALNRELPRIGHRVVEEASPIMRHMPFVFTPLIPLGLLPYPIARALWFHLSLAATLIGCIVLWRRYGGPPRSRGVPWVLGIAFLPTLLMLQKGQMGWLALIGGIGWAYFAERRSWIGAGIGLWLMLFKPHLVYLALLAILIWSAQRRAWTAVAVGGAMAAMGTALAAAFRPSILLDYAQAIYESSPFAWATPTLGSWLRWLLDVDAIGLQFVPPVLGLAWLGACWRTFDRMRKGKEWESFPDLFAVSSLTALYGWSFDWVTWLWPVIQTWARLPDVQSPWARWGLIVAYVGLQGFALAIHQHGGGDFWLAGLPWGLMLWRWLARRATLKS